MNLSYLEDTLKNLRSKWPSPWPGMSVVVRQALHELGHVDGTRLTAPDQALHDCIFSVIDLIEEDGSQRHASGHEPSYHNRLHFCDTVVCLTALLVNQRIHQAEPLQAPLSHFEWVAMLAMVSHDLLHSGGINQFPSEIERHSVEVLRPLMQAQQVDEADQALVAELIVKTDPKFVPASHEAVQGVAFVLTDPRCLTVLIQESDIMASALPGIGNDLTLQLSNEWKSIAPDLAASLLTPKSRIYFLRHMALFSSPSSRLLGIQSIIDREVQALELA